MARRCNGIAHRGHYKKNRGVGIKRIEPKEVATAVHKGSLKKIGKLYPALVAWIEESGYQIVGPAEEVYLSPSGTPPQELLTEVRFEVRKRENKSLAWSFKQ